MDFGRWRVWLLVLAGTILLGTRPELAVRADEAARKAQAAEKKKADVPRLAPPQAKPKKDSDQEFKTPNVFVPADRTVLRLLDRAQLLLEQERYAEAVRCLGTILDSPEDYFFQPDNSGPVHLSLKSEAQRLLGRLPRAGTDLYELQYGARARQMLNEAAAAGDATALAEVARRFYHTQAGYEATLLLGLNHLDHGRWLAAALVLQRLRDTASTADQFEPTLSLSLATSWLRAGSNERAQEALVALKARQTDGKITVGGKEIALFGRASEAAGWLTRLVGQQPETAVSKPDNWAMVRGNVARSAVTSASGPLLSQRWRVPTTDHPVLENLIKQVEETDHERDEWTLPGLHPLVVDDMVLMRTAQTLVGIDFVTGKRIWEVPVEDPFEAILNPPPDSTFSPPFQRGPQMEQGLRYRLWGDATYGTLSSDGKRVFAIEDLRLETGMTPVMNGMFLRGQRQTDAQGPRSHNRLAAYDIRTGKLAWHIGGSPEEFGLPQAGTFFLGPPLPLMENLFVIAEVKGEIRLMALDAKTGNLLWSQQLADIDRDVLNDPLRRLSGASPSYADGILVCPTSNKSIVAVDLAGRSLLWGYAFTRDDESNQQAMFLGLPSMMNVSPAGRWTDSSAILSGGRVLATPVESNDIHCLNLVDGKLLWKQPRQDDLYLASVHQGKVVLVGKQRVRALNLEDGAAAWSTNLPSGSHPSGTGFLSGDVYHVPLTSAEVLAIDLKKGEVENVFKSRRSVVPGNLVCYKGMVVSQRADAVDVFYQQEALKNLVDQRLADSPNDASAHRLRGELLWHQGQLDEAVAAFQRSLELNADPATRDLLRDVYFDGLQTDFAGHQGRVADIERLIDTPCQRATLLRLLAVGYERTGDLSAALDHYLKLIELDHSNRELDSVGPQLAIRRDRWIQGRLAALGESGRESVRKAIDEAAGRQLQAAQKAGTADALRQFLNYFGSHPLADEAREKLLDKLRASGQLLEAELLLLRQSRDSRPERAAAAVAQLAELFRAADRHRDAAICYAQLAQLWADVPCAGGKTGSQLMAALGPDDPVRCYLQAPSWPRSRIDVGRNAARAPSSPYVPSTVEYVGRRNPFFEDVNIELNINPAQLVARDGLGNPLWQVAMAETVGIDRFMFSRSMTRLAVAGHLMLVSMGDKLLAIDTLSAADHRPRILWREELQGTPDGLAGAGPQIQVVVAAAGGRVRRVRYSEGFDIPLSAPEMISEQLVCMRQNHRCMALDPATGETLWQRQDVRPDSDIFGDDEYLFIVPVGETKARVFRSLDGQLLGERDVPAERVATFGRTMLVWRDSGNQGELAMIDAWTGKPVWPAKPFPSGAQVHLVNDHCVALFEPGGRLLLVNLSDGRAIVDTQVAAEAPLSELFVLRSPGQYLVLIQGPERAGDDNRHTHQIPGTASQRITKAHVYAFNDKGKSMWESPVTVEDQFLPLDQPSHLPVLFFAAMVQQRKAESPVMATNTILLGIDKRNGHVICNEVVPNGNNSLTLVGNPSQRTVEVRFQRETITLTFSDQAATASEAFWKAVRKAVFFPGRPAASPRSGPPQPQEKQAGEGSHERTR